MKAKAIKRKTEEIEMPKCDKCKKNDKVRLVLRGIPSTDFWCRRCKLGWTQPI